MAGEKRHPEVDAAIGAVDQHANADNLGLGDGHHLAHAAKVSDRAAQLFVKELLDLGLVRIVPDAPARGTVVERDEDALVDWYLRRAGADAK